MRFFSFFLLLFLAVGSLHAQLIMKEDFTQCNNLTSQGWTAFTNQNQSAIGGCDGGLTYPGYSGSGTGNSASISQVVGEGVERAAATSNTNVYAGFLINASSANATGGLVLSFNTNGSTALQNSGFTLNNNFFGLTNNGVASYDGITSSTGSTSLIVLKLSPTGTYSLYINPALGGSEPAPNVTVTPGSTPTVVYGLRIHQRNVMQGNIDGIRVGNSWADIVGGGAGTGLLMTENFSAGGGLPSNGWTGYNGCCISTTSSLNYPGYSNGGGGSMSADLTGNNISMFKAFPAVSTGTVYASFLVDVQNFGNNPNFGSFNFYSTASGNSFNQQQGFITDNSNQFGLRNSMGSTSYAGSYGSSTFLVVIGYNVDTDMYSMWVNPSTGQTSPPGAQIMSFVSGLPVPYVDGISISDECCITQQLRIGEIHVSTDWKDVVTYAPPTSQPTNLVINSAGTTSIAGTFTQISGGGSLNYLVVRSTTPLVGAPVNGINYSTNQPIGNGFVGDDVCCGTFNISGLTAGTLYYINIFAYQTSGSPVYNAIAPLQGIAATELSNGAPGNPTFSNIQDTQMDVSFTAAATPGSGYVAFRNTGGGSPNPQNGVSYEVGDLVSGWTVVYRGTGTSFTDTGLSPLTNYNYEVYSFSGVSSYENYFNNSGDSGQSTIAASPTAQPTGILFSNRTTTAMTVSFTAATGFPNGYLLIGRPGSSPTDDAPVDGTTYTVGATFPAAGAGAFIAGSSSSTSFVVNNPTLTPNTEYFFDIYSYNGTGTQRNYLQTGPLSGSAYTILNSEPSTQPTVLTFNTITSTGFNASFTAAGGAGANGYVVLRRTSTITDSPTDGSFYNVNDPVGSSVVAYIGTSTSFSQSGLAGNTTYFYRIFSYNVGAHPSTVNFFTGGLPLLNSQATLVSVPTATAPTALTQTSFTANWGAVTGATSYRLDVATDAGFASILGGYNNLTVATNSQSVTGLTAGTTYYYRVRAVGAGGTTANSNVITTLTVPPNPVASAGTLMTTTTFQANWSAATSATSYRLDVANDIGFTSILGSYNNLNIPSGTLQAVSGLTAGNTYYYRVRAVNASGTSSNSGTITVLLISPAPVNSASTSITNTGFTINWAITNGAASYRLDVDDDSGFGSMNVNNLTVAGTSSAVSGLAANTTYYYRVRAFNATGTSANSTTANTKTATNAPVASAGTAMTASSFTANWASVTGATNYSLDVANDAGFSSILGGYNNLTVASTSQNVTGLTAGNTYYYRVRANNPSASPSSSTITVLLIPPAPVATAATAPSVTDFTANWNAANGAVNYRLDVSTDNFSTFFSPYNDLTVAGLSQLVTGLSSGTTYQYRVRAVNASGTSLNSNVISIIALPPGPTANAASSVANTSFTANWSSVGGSDYYGFEVSTDNFSSTIPGYSSTFTTTNTSQAVSGLTQGGTYQYRARAHNASGFSAYSGSITVTLLADVPVSTAATSVTSTGFTANWNAAAGAASYLLDVSSDNFGSLLAGYPSSETGTSKTISDLTPGTTYQYRLRAVTAGGETVNSSTVTVLLAPAAPVALAATAVTQTTFTANWNAVGGAMDYFVDVATNNPPTSFVTGFSNKQVTGATSLAVTGLSPGTTYYYQVRSSNATGASENSNVITSVTVTDAPTTPVAEQIAPDGFLATWNPVAGAAGYKIDVSKDNFATFATGYDGKDVGGVTEEFVVGLLSSTLYRFRVRAYNSASMESANSSFKSVRTAGGVVTTPQITNIEFSDKFSGSGNDKIKVTLSGGEGEKTFRFFRRSIQSAAFTSEVTKPATQSSYEFTVQDAWLDKTGLEFYFRYEDEINQSTESAHKFIYRVFNQEPVPNLTAGGTLESYRIFSVPVKLDDNSISEVFKSVETQFGGYDKTKWRLVRYEGGRNVDYTEGLNKIDQGKGYWFNSIENVTVKISGSVIPLDQANPFKLALESGWTQVGNPYPFEISWVDVLALNNNPSGVGKLFTYDANNVSFKEAGGLKAWEGGFVKSDNATTVNIPVTVKQSATGRSGYSEIENQDLSKPDWMVPFAVKIGKAYNQMGGIGMHAEAKPGNDRFDEQSLPRFIKYLELNSYHNDYFLPRFTRDVVPTAVNHNWDYVVESNFDDSDAVLTWDNKSLGDNDAQLLLYDVDENVLIDMKVHGEYRFNVTEKHRLKFFYSADGKSLSPDITGLGRPYPNPSVSSIAIPFVAGVNSSEIQIGVYDMMGRQVKSIVNQRFAPGMHEATWDGNDEQGGRVAQGVYIYRLTSNNTPAQQGRIVMK